MIHQQQLWLGYVNQTRLSTKIGLWNDIHYRESNLDNKPTLAMWRSGLNYYLQDNIRITGGYASVFTYPDNLNGDFLYEHRPWAQIWWSNKYQGFNTVQWLRPEYRIRQKMANDKKTNDFESYFRVRANLSLFVPLNNNEIKAGTIFLSMNNEVFVNMGSQIVYNIFDQNRLALGLGYQFSPTMNIQINYLNVYSQAPNGITHTNVDALRVFVFHNLDFRKKEENQ